MCLFQVSKLEIYDKFNSIVSLDLMVLANKR